MTTSSDATTGSVATRFDVTRQILRVQFRGRVTKDAMARHLSEIEELESRLAPGFTLASDLSELDEIESGCLETLIRVMETLRRAEVRTVVRWIPYPEKDIGFAILSAFHYPSDVSCFNCETAAEYRQWLDSLEEEREA